jgi:chemotaxis protein MotB
VVSGHTDNTPINTEQYPSNLELSSARAINVAKFLIDNGVSPHRVSIQGFSEYRPLFENTSHKNRQANRRVEIALIKEQNGT